MQVVEIYLSPWIKLFWLIKVYLLLSRVKKNDVKKKMYVIAITLQGQQQGHKKTLLESGFLHILKPCLLQREPYHHWVPALVFRRQGNAC